ncbi:MAG: Sec-independent protein translocase protein TatB [Pseudomonadota bacterium]
MSLVPQLGLPEILVLSVLALLVIGPKDLPKFLHGVGQMVGKARRLADEFRAGLSQMAREVEMEEMRKEIEELKKSSGAQEATDTFREIEGAVKGQPTSSTSGDQANG